MIRVLNFFAFAVTALACLALYHVSEQTRVAQDKLVSVNQAIVREQGRISKLQAQWSHVAAPARIQMLAETRLGLSDTPVVELSSLTLLPQRGETLPGDAQIRSASAVVPAQAPNPGIRLAAMRAGN
jgi:cell division protein FtsL